MTDSGVTKPQHSFITVSLSKKYYKYIELAYLQNKQTNMSYNTLIMGSVRLQKMILKTYNTVFIILQHGY